LERSWERGIKGVRNDFSPAIDKIEINGFLDPEVVFEEVLKGTVF